MAKEILKPSSENGAFLKEGDRVEFELPYSTEIMTVSAVEINMKSGATTIHEEDDKGHEWIIQASSLIRVFNKELTLIEKEAQ